jgi:dTDP-glucose 4,6-dehydratase
VVGRRGEGTVEQIGVQLGQQTPGAVVTGGAGFIGGNFVLQQVPQAMRVVNLDALTYAGNRDTLAGLDGNSAPRLRPGRHRRPRAGAPTAGRAPPDAIVNFAAESHVDRSIDGPAAFVQTNVVGTFNAARSRARLLEPSWMRPRARRFRFLHVSTDEVYGSLGDDRQVHRDHALRSPTRPTRPPRPRPTTWCAPGTTPTGCRC